MVPAGCDPAAYAHQLWVLSWKSLKLYVAQVCGLWYMQVGAECARPTLRQAMLGGMQTSSEVRASCCWQTVLWGA